MINKLLLSLFIVASISACNADTDSESSLSPELQTKIEHLNEMRDKQISKVKAMNLSKENEDKYIKGINKEVDGTIAGLVMQKDLERTPEEINSSNKRAYEQYEKAFGTDEERAEKRKKQREATIEKHMREQKKRDQYIERRRAEELQRQEQRNQRDAEFRAKLKRDQEIADQRQERVDRELAKFNRTLEAARERSIRVKEAADRKRQQQSNYYQ